MLIPLLVLGEIGHASRAQIVAALPPVLRFQEKPDPGGEARYRTVVAIAAKAYSPGTARAFYPDADAATRHRAVELGRPLLEGLAKALSGPLRVPRKDKGAFPGLSGVKAFAKLLALTTRDAAEHGDRAACLRCATLGLRLSDGLIHAGGDVLFLSVAVATEAIADRAVEEADAAGGLTSEGRRKVLALMPALTSVMPELAQALRRDFAMHMLPVLIDPIRGWRESYGEPMMPSSGTAKAPVGNYDPIATARVVGREYEIAIENSRRPLGMQSDEADRLVTAALSKAPSTESAASKRYLDPLRRMPNSIGFTIASIGPPERSIIIGVRRATYRNLARAAILLRHGERAVVPDPFGKGPLRVDPKRRIVWSVGENGKDDGGQIGKGFGAKAPDLGYRY